MKGTTSEDELEEGGIREELLHANNWGPESPDDFYKISPPFSVPNKGTGEPLEIFNVMSSRLPVHGLKAGPSKNRQPVNVGTFTPVRTIFDTGAEFNYITARKA